MTLAADPQTTEALQKRITELEQDIFEIRRAKATSAAHAAHPDVRGVILYPPADVERAFTAIPTGDHSWLRGRADELASGKTWPTSRLLLNDGTVVEDRDRAAAIIAVLADGYYTDTLDEVLPGVPTVDVLATIGWPALATVTDEEAAHDRDAITDERNHDTYADARQSLADALLAVISLTSAAEEDQDLTAVETELAAAHHALRTAVTADITGHVLAVFPDTSAYTVGYTPDVLILLAVRTPTGRVYDFEDVGEDVHFFNTTAGIHLIGNDTDVPAEWVNPFTGEQIVGATTIEVVR